MAKRYPNFRGMLMIMALLVTGAAQLLATHNRAGEISIEQVGNCGESLTVRATILTYTKISAPVDRDSLEICWGDGNCEMVARQNGPGMPPRGEPLENDVKRNVYIAVHTFPARGTYQISMTDPNRNTGILNVNFPNSEQIKFFIQTTYTFPNPQFQGCNDTPVLLQPPVDIACVGQPFTHNPNAYDRDGDSLAYRFIVPLQDRNLAVPNYVFPDMIAPGPDNELTINEVTGDILWDAPQRGGEYNLAMIIIEYREGLPLDTIIRDMQILVEECDNEPPEVETPFDEVCVVAGDTLEFDVTSTAPLFETPQQVRLTALGGPFEVDINPATFTPNDNTFQDDPVTKTFRWATDCEHISDQFYSVVFKGTDNALGDTSGLATLKTVRIKVVGPPPEDVRASPDTGRIVVSWKKPYACEDTEFDFFRGFTIWRRVGSNQFPLDTCAPGLAGRGYERLTPVPVMEMQDGRYVFVDETVEQGRTYCYRILARFAQTTPSGLYTFNIVESLPSEEACVQLNRNVPLITNVDVRNTSTTDGSIEVCWSKPAAEDLDTLANPGPYRYEILRATGQTTNPGEFQPIGLDFVSETFAGANDTCFVDTLLNTQDNPYSYRINFYTSGRPQPLGATNPASSVFLSAQPTDRRINLSWEELIPWDNFTYTVFLENAQGTFDSIGTTNNTSFQDRGLINGVEYCYRVESSGSYGVKGVIDPILNFSQEVCAVPIDNVALCPTVLEVSNICDVGSGCNGQEDLFNSLRWESPNEICEDGGDALGYNIYFTPLEGGDLELVATIEDPDRLTFEHQPEVGLAGCYAVTSLDSAFNESPLSNIVCVENCPTYELPNAFTPNGDGQNEFFRPYPYCFVERVEFQVFNRWGKLVFQTQDPDLNWDGANLNGDELAEGVYYYVCRVFEQRLSGVQERQQELSGYIELIRGGSR